MNRLYLRVESYISPCVDLLALNDQSSIRQIIFAHEIDLAT